MNPKTITVNKLKQVGEAMNTSFFERKEQNEVVENKLEELKKSCNACAIVNAQNGKEALRILA